MIVSHRHRFIFIKTRKTAGTSLEIFLSGLCGPDDVLTPIEPHQPPHQPRHHEGFINHMPAHEVRERVGQEVWRRYFKFCVERNPWDKTLSHFFMQRARKLPDMDLDAYLARHNFPRDLPKYTEPGQPSQVIVDQILRYESLDADLGRVCQQLGLPWGGALDVHAKADYRDDRRPYQAVYNPAQAEVVAKAFRPEIKLLGYRF